LKFKKCCLGKDATELDRPPISVYAKAGRIFEDREKRAHEYRKQFGDVRQHVTTEAFGKRMISVGNKIFGKEWKFFSDFLRDFVPAVFEDEWCRAEMAKPAAERHPVTEWRTQGALYMNAQPAQPDGSRAAPPSGALAAYICFAYDLFIVADNGGLDVALLKRLKTKDLFQGARHELFAEDTCLRAGFTVQHEDERDGNSRHVEFTAKHKATGQLLSIEAKSKHHAGVLGFQGAPLDKLPDFRFGRLINDAVGKKPPHPLVIFLDTNLSPKWADRLYSPHYGPAQSGQIQPIPSRFMQSILNRVQKLHDGVDPYSLIVFSNHPHHYAPDDLDPRRHLFSVLPEHQTANLGALRALHNAANLYGNIPNRFSLDDPDPPTPVFTPTHKVRYDFDVTEAEVRVTREGQTTDAVFATKVVDRAEAPSPLHDFLESIGRSRVDAHMVCDAIESGQSVHGVMGSK
jgi:hypothetical protein